jgi:hypothetical protein
MQSKLKAIGVFIKDHFMMAVFCAAALFAFLFLPHFQEMAYGIFRVGIAIFFVAALIYLWFKDTIREYLVSGQFVTDFTSLEAKHKVAVTMTVIIAILWAVVECLVHP